jgi:hypothetical protein
VSIEVVHLIVLHQSSLTLTDKLQREIIY